MPALPLFRWLSFCVGRWLAFSIIISPPSFSFYLHIRWKHRRTMLCCLGVSKSIRPVQTEWWGVGVVICLNWGADCLHMVQLMPLPSETPSSLVSFKSRPILPFWYRLTRVVLEKRPLKVCSSSSGSHVLGGSPHPLRGTGNFGKHLLAHKKCKKTKK